MSAADAGRASGGAGRAFGGAALATGLVAGWLVHDLAVFFRGGEPLLVLERLGPGSAAALAVAVVYGLALGGRPRLQLAALALVALASWRYEARLGPFKLSVDDLLRSLTALLAAFALGDWLARRLDRGAAARVLLGLGSGLAACMLKTHLALDGEVSPPATALAGGTLALLAGLASGPGRTASRGPLAALAIFAAVTALGLGWSARSGSRLGRPDLAPPATRADAAAPDLLLIVLDTTRADHLGSYGYARDTTPHLDAFGAEHMIRFTNARASSPFTLPSHGSLLTGLFSGEHGASVGGLVSRPLREDAVSLAQRLRERGYRTGAVVANQMYVNSALGFDRGFEHFDERVGTDVGRYSALAQGLGLNAYLGRSYRDAERITDLALDWLRADRDAPYFLMLNYLDPHDPLCPPEDLRTVFEDEVELDDTVGQHIRLYDAELIGLDRQLQRLFDHLEQSGTLERTVVVVTSDHGEAFGEHGITFHCWTLYEELLHVPLFIKPVGRGHGRVDDEPITAPMVHDRMLVELGIEPGPRPERPPGLTGEWYPWPLSAKNERLQDRLGWDLSTDSLTWLRDGIKTIVYSDGRVTSYDLAADPDELAPLELSREELEGARREAAEWWSEHPLPSEPVEVDAEQRKRLKALGYG